MSVELAAKKPKAGPPPKEALDYFKRKKLKPSFDYTEVWKEEHDLAFTVAKVTELKILAHVRDTIEAALKNGETLETWKKNVMPRLEKSGWRKHVSDEALPSRLKLIYQTNMRVARANGQEDRAQQVKDFLPYFIYELGPSKEHRPEHVKMAGTIKPINDPIWRYWSPPCAYGCNCRRRQISRPEANKLGGESDTPKQQMVKWKFPDGKIETVPAGVHPSFAYPKNAAGRREQLQDELRAAKTNKSGPEKANAAVALFSLFKEFVAKHAGGGDKQAHARQIAQSLTDGARRVIVDIVGSCPNEHDTTGLTKLDCDVKTARKYVDGELTEKGLIGRRQNRVGLYPTELARAVHSVLVSGPCSG